MTRSVHSEEGRKEVSTNSLHSEEGRRTVSMREIHNEEGRKKVHREEEGKKMSRMAIHSKEGGKKASTSAIYDEVGEKKLPKKAVYSKEGGNKVAKKISREVQADGTVVEIVETSYPNGSKTVQRSYISPTKAPTSYPNPGAPTFYPNPDASTPYSFPDTNKPQHRNNEHHQKAADSLVPIQHENRCCDLPRFGAQAECSPGRAHLAKEGMIEWAWFPEWSWLAQLILLCGFVTFIGLILIIIFGLEGTALIAIGVVLFIIGFASLYVVYTWQWNINKQEAYIIARGKRLEALEIWKNIDPIFSYIAKDTFFETKYGGKTLRVLRDGTIEVHGAHNAVEFGMPGLHASHEAAGDLAASMTDV